MKDLINFLNNLHSLNGQFSEFQILTSVLKTLIIVTFFVWTGVISQIWDPLWLKTVEIFYAIDLLFVVTSTIITQPSQRRIVELSQIIFIPDSFS